MHIRLLRELTTGRRSALAFSLTRTVMELARRSIARLNPGASDDEIGIQFVAQNYGEDLARGVRERLSRKQGM